MSKVRFHGTFRVDHGVLTNQGRVIFRRWLDPALEAIAQQAKVEAPVRTGRLRDSIRVSPIRWVGLFKAEGKVEATVPYAVFVHEGTRPHVIRARNAKALHFQMHGRDVFCKSVHHPGTKPNPFMMRAATKVVASRLR